MGWFWGSSNPDGSPQDPYSKLDPALREFLEKESPLKYEDTKPKPGVDSQVDNASYRSQFGLNKPGLDQIHQNATPGSDKSAVPAESLYQDGRYAHLWKTYRPQTDVENGSRSDQDRMRDVFDAYNDRQAAIGRAAVENCVMEQIAEKECFSSGSWYKRASMCREENRAFSRCYEMQSRFLKALGYLSVQRNADEEERIQMHADKLYQEMLERERVAEEARKEGRDVPASVPLIQPESTTKALGKDSAWARARQQATERKLPNQISEFPPEKRKQIQDRIKDMNEDEKQLELQLIAAESRANLEYADKVREALRDEKSARAERRDRGRETMGDAMKRWWGWDK